VRWVRSQVRGVPAHTLIWTLVACSATFCLLQGLREGNKHRNDQANKAAATVSDHTRDVSDGSPDHLKEVDEEEEEEDEDGGNSEDELEEGEGEEKDAVSDDEEKEEDERMERWDAWRNVRKRCR